MFEQEGKNQKVPTVVAATLLEIKETLEQIKGKKTREHSRSRTKENSRSRRSSEH